MQESRDDPNIAADPLNHRPRPTTAPEATPRWVVGFALVAAALFLGFVAIHLTGHGLGHHGVGSQAPARTEIDRDTKP